MTSDDDELPANLWTDDSDDSDAAADEEYESNERGWKMFAWIVVAAIHGALLIVLLLRNNG